MNNLKLSVAFAALDKLTGPISKMSKAGKMLGRDISQTRKQLSELNGQQKTIGKFKDLRAGLSDSQTALLKTRQKLQELQRQMAATAQPTKAMQNAVKGLEREEKALNKTISKQTKNLDGQQKALRDSGIDVDRLADHERNLAQQIAKTNTKLDQQSTRMKRMNDFSRRADKLSGGMMRVGAATSVASTAIAFFGKQSFDAAMNAEEMQSAFDVTFGKASQSVKAWAESTGDQMGRSTQEMQRGAMAFEELFSKALDPEKSVGMSKSFAVLTQDLASFKNLSNEVAQQKLFSGLSGEAEPLRAVGVFLSAAKVEAAATALGLEKVNGKLTEEQKIIARAAVIKQELAKANGDVMRTSDSAANKLKKLAGVTEEAQVSIGQKLLPVITPFIDKLGNMVERFGKLPPSMQKTIVVVLAIVAALGPLLLIGSSLVTVIGALAPLFAGVTIAAGPLIAIVAAIAAAGALIYYNWDKIAPVLAAVGERINAVLGPRLQSLINTVTDGLSKLWNGPFGQMIGKVIGILGKLYFAYNMILGEAIMAILSALMAVFETVFSQIVNILTFVGQVLTGDFGGAWETVQSMVSTSLQGVISVIDALVPSSVSKMLNMGVQMVKGLVNGILAAPGAVLNALSSLVTTGVEWVGSYLQINSPSRRFIKLGEATAKGMAVGIEKRSGESLTAAKRLATGVAGAGALALSPAPALAAGGASGGQAGAGQSAAPVSITIHVHGTEGQAPDDIAKAVMAQIERKMNVQQRRSYSDG